MRNNSIDHMARSMETTLVALIPMGQNSLCLKTEWSHGCVPVDGASHWPVYIFPMGCPFVIFIRCHMETLYRFFPSERYFPHLTSHWRSNGIFHAILCGITCGVPRNIRCYVDFSYLWNAPEVLEVSAQEGSIIFVTRGTVLFLHNTSRHKLVFTFRIYHDMACGIGYPM